MRIRYKVSTRSLISALYVFSMMFAYSRYIGEMSLGNTLQYCVGFFWIIVGVACSCSGRFRYLKDLSSDCFWLILVFFVPHLLVHLYTFILMIFGLVDFKYANLNLSVYVPTLFAIFSFYLFRRRALGLNIIAIMLSWAMSFCASIYTWGIEALKGAIIQAYFYDKAWVLGYVKNHLEFHDIALAVGYYFVFYIYCKDEDNNCTKRRLVFFIIMSLVSFKKIVVVGIAIAWMFRMVVKRCSVINRYKLCIYAGWIIVIFSVLFVYDLYNTGLFFLLVEKYRINTMNRVVFFKMMIERTEFSPFFLGIGRNTVAQLFERELYWDKFDLSLIGAVHCDILKMYVENGFFIFILWLCYKLVFVTKLLKKRFDQNVAIFYFGSLIYTFVLYITDNTEVYFACQILSLLMIMTYAGKEKYGFEDKLYDISGR